MNFDATEPVVILGFGQMGQVSHYCKHNLDFEDESLILWHNIYLFQVLANLLSAPLASGLDGDLGGWPYIVFDLDPKVVKVCEIWMNKKMYRKIVKLIHVLKCYKIWLICFEWAICPQKVF